MNTKRSHLAWASLLAVAALALSLAGCNSAGEGAACGPNTRLDESTNECVLDLPPGMNIIVDDFSIGDFEMTNVDVPEQLAVGTPDTRTFTITNKGAEDRPVVLIRYAIAPVESDIEELRDAIDNMTDGTELGATFLGVTIIKDLTAGESRTVEYNLNVPNTVADGLYGMMFAVDEVPLVETGDEGYAVDFSAAGMADAANTARLGDAALVHAPATVIIGKPDRPNLRVLFTNMDNNSFELDETEGAKVPMFSLSARMSSQALDLTEPVTASFALKLAGHSPKTPGQDLGIAWFEAKGLDFDSAPETTEWEYDANRTFPLLMLDGEDLVASKTYGTVCRTETVAPDESAGEDAEPVEVERCATIFNEEGRDDVYRLHLRAEDIRLLELTAGLPAFNPDLDENLEVQGQLLYQLATPQQQYEDNVGDDVAALPVVFLAPAEAAAATESDVDDGGVTEAPNGTTGPYSYVIKNDLTASSFGNEWFGGGYRLENQASAEKYWDVVTAGYRKAGARIYATLLKMEVDILNIGGTLDWNVKNPIDEWEANAKLIVMNYAVLDASFTEGYCETEDMVTFCPLFEAAPQGVEPKEESKKADKGEKSESEEEGRSLTKEWKFNFMAGPVPLVIQAEVGIQAGITFTGKFVIDQSEPVFKYGVEFAAGPYVGLGATVFGGISIGIARAGVEGNLSILRLEFMPRITPLVRQAVDGAKDCYKYATTTLTFDGPLTLKGPYGDVSIVAYVGFKFCLFGKCLKWEVKVFGFTIAKFSTFEKTWTLWSITKEWSKAPGEEGMCTDALEPPDKLVWSSPTSCSGKYCNASSSGTATSRSPSKVLSSYKVTYDLANVPSGCVDVTVTGTTETGCDPVVLYNADGATQNSEKIGTKTVPGWSGEIAKTLRVCSSKVTAALETNASGARSGVTVTFEPVR